MTQVLLDKAAIEEILPHRDPMLLIDEVIELVPGERVVARKTVTEADCAGSRRRRTAASSRSSPGSTTCASSVSCVRATC